MEWVFRSSLICLLLCLCEPRLASAQGDDYLLHSGFVNELIFNDIDVNNGLSQNSVTCILQDQKGFIWVGTYDGLNRFDGIEVKQKRHESNNKFSLADNRILALCQLDSDRMLVGTEGGGVMLYYSHLEQFFPLRLENPQHQMTVAKSICTDKSGNIWVASHKSLVVVDRHQDNIPFHQSWLLSDFNNDEINKVFCDRAGNIWVATENGLYMISYKDIAGNNKQRSKTTMPVAVKKVRSGNVKVISQDKEHTIWYGGYGTLGLVKVVDNRVIDLPSYRPLMHDLFAENASLRVSGIVQDLKGSIWIATDNLGLVKCGLNNQGEYFMAERYHTGSTYGRIPEDNLNCVYVDHADNLWLGTFHSGVAHASLVKKNIYSFSPLLERKSGKYVTTVFDDKEHLWVGTMDSGLQLYDKAAQHFKTVPGIKAKSVLSFFRTADQTVYLGTSNGLYVFEEKEIDIGHKKLLFPGKAIRAICKDSFGRIWLATWQGILLWHPDSGHFENFTHKDGLSSNTGYVMHKDSRENVIWYGTIGGGLNKISYDKNGIQEVGIFQQEGSGNGLSNNHVWCIYEDDGHQLWVGTDAGLSYIKSGKVFRIDHPSIRNRKITSIQKDELSRLWLGSGQGLICFDPIGNEVRQYTNEDGLRSNTLTEAVYKSANGLIFFGNIGGLNAIVPKDVRQNPYAPKTAFTDFRVHNEALSPGMTLNGRQVLAESVNIIDRIVLHHDENSFALSLAALHYASPSANKFKYMLGGYDKDWLYTDPGKFSVAYSHLPAGNYKLQVASANNDGVWAKELKTLDIIIKPAPWWTWWAKTSYALALCIAGYFVFSAYSARKKIGKQVFIEQYEKEKIVELNELKLDFFTKITHELRTPLSFIINPAADLVENKNIADPYINLRANIIHKNALRLYDLINQVLDLRKVSQTNYALHLAEDNLYYVLTEIKQSFALLAESRKIQFTLDAQPTDQQAWLDKEKLEKIIYNLVANAFKFTPDAGKVAICLSYRDRNGQLWAALEVKDSGQGIPQEDLDKVFDMYYQSQHHSGVGTGIGLALVKKLVAIHKGNIHIESTLGVGTSFSLEIPIDRSFYDENAFDGAVDNEMPDSKKMATSMALPHDNLEGNTIIVLDDENEQLDYVKDVLGAQYTVIGTDSGAVAFDLAKKSPPQLIISDLVMSEINGCDFLLKIKGDVRTNHIPVIIHSVQNDKETIKRVMEAGADDFISKFVNYDDLKTKINNVIFTRKRLIETLYKDGITAPMYKEIPAADDELLKKIVQFIEKNIANPDFSVEKLSKELGMSRMSLHRKLDAIIGKTASQLIREIRMKVAGKLLSSGSYRISEAMYEVGILNNYYFNKYFKEMYGITPKEYIQKEGIS